MLECVHTISCLDFESFAKPVHEWEIIARREALGWYMVLDYQMEEDIAELASAVQACVCVYKQYTMDTL